MSVVSPAQPGTLNASPVGTPHCGSPRTSIVVANAGATYANNVADDAVVLARLDPAASRAARVDARGTLAGAGIAAAPYRQSGSASSACSVGTAIAVRLAALGGEIAWWEATPEGCALSARDSLIDLAHWCTTLLVVARGNAIGLIDAAVIETVGADGLIVNVTRGAVIDEDALIAALRNGRLIHAARRVRTGTNSPRMLGECAERHPDPAQRRLHQSRNGAAARRGGAQPPHRAQQRAGLQRDITRTLCPGRVIGRCRHHAVALY